MAVRILHGDCRVVLPALAAEGVRAHACVTDPPYDLGFMGKRWDATGVAFDPATWRAVYDVLLPGAYLVAFGGTRTSHRMVCAIEDARFEIRDSLSYLHDGGLSGPLLWAFANGFPKNRNALKPAHEPICLARKPLSEPSVIANIQAHGTGALNIDGCRIHATDKTRAPVGQYGAANIGTTGHTGLRDGSADHIGRWPANVLHDGSDEVLEAFAAYGEQTSRGGGEKLRSGVNGACYGKNTGGQAKVVRNDTGTAARFFFSAKATAAERASSKHPTVKPQALMRWLIQLVTPPGGLVLDPFAGSGSTGLAADQLGHDAILIEQDAEYVADARRKIAADAPLFAAVSAA